jgi:predicted DNA-binding protein
MGDRDVNGKNKTKRTTIRIPDETLAKIQEIADRRGRSLNVTVVDLIEGGIDWLRDRYQIVK